MTATWYAHYIDANNYYGFQVTQTSLSITSKFLGIVDLGRTTATTTTIALVPGMQYWIKMTLFPTSYNGQYLQALLYTDNGGAATTLLGTVGPTPYWQDNVYDLHYANSCVIAASGAALGLGGNYSSVHSVSQFGPGGWYFSSSGTGVSSGAWEILAQLLNLPDLNLLKNGPVKSYGAARIDAPKAGTWNASWTLGNTTSGTTVQLTGVLRPRVLKMVAFVLFNGVSTTCTAKLQINEYDINGAYLATYSVSGASFTCSNSGFYGNYLPLTGTYTPTGAAYYIIPVLNVADTVSGGSSGGWVMWENIQLWDSQKYGATMPYCEMWFNQSPAQLVVTGLVGDVPSPITLSVGTQLTSNTTLKLAIGRRAFSTANMQMVSPQYSLFGGVPSYSGVRFAPVLDSTAYYGYYLSASSLTNVALMNNVETPSIWILPMAESSLPVGIMQQGIYHLYTRFQSGQSLANIKNVSVTPQISQLGPYGVALQATRYYPATTPLSASATWTLADAGQVLMPPFPIGALSVFNAMNLAPQVVWADSTAGSSSAKMNYAALLPVDGSKCLATINLPTGYGGTYSILNIYSDGIGAQAGYPTPWTTSGSTNTVYGSYNGLNGGTIILGINSADPTSSIGGPGTSSTNTVSINPVGDSFLTVDPTLAPSTTYLTSSLATGTTPTSLNNGLATAAMNQFVVIMTDSVGAIYPVYAQLQYVPLYKEVQ